MSDRISLAIADAEALVHGASIGAQIENLVNASKNDPAFRRMAAQIKDAQGRTQRLIDDARMPDDDPRRTPQPMSDLDARFLYSLFGKSSRERAIIHDFVVVDGGKVHDAADLRISGFVELGSITMTIQWGGRSKERKSEPSDKVAMRLTPYGENCLRAWIEKWGVKVEGPPRAIEG